MRDTPIASDAALDELLRASSPYPASEPAELPPTAEAHVGALLAQAARPPRVHRPRRRAWQISLPVAATAAFALVLALLAGPVSAPEPAAARGLPPLTYQSSSLSAGEAIDRAQALLAEPGGIDAPLREAHSNAWYAHISFGADAESSSAVISPENTVVT